MAHRYPFDSDCMSYSLMAHFCDLNMVLDKLSQQELHGA